MNKPRGSFEGAGGPAMAMALCVLSFGAGAQPPAPNGLAAAPGDAEAVLSWTDPSDDAITGYAVRYATSAAALSSGGAAWSAISGSDAATTAHTVPSLANGVRYYFQVRATDADGDGTPSNVATTRLAASPAAVVAIDDSGLRNALEQSLGATAGADITQLDLAILERLSAYGFGISDLSGLEHAVNLTSLSLSNNEIEDVSALGSLESLVALWLFDNAISDVSALASLQSLRWLYLRNNTISDVSALGSLQSLAFLDLQRNAISDVSALGSLQSLTTLLLHGNAIEDVSALRSLQSLTDLGLGNNAIEDVSALRSLEALTTLSLGYNGIEDFSALGSLQSLQWLDLSGNAISDVSALGSLQSLQWLYLIDNAISDVSALGSLQSLAGLWLGDNEIEDVSALGSLESLATLGLGGNAIEDVTALGSLETLTELGLQRNAISDVSALVRNMGIGDGDHLDLRGNPLSTESIETHIPALLQRGVEVLFDIPSVEVEIAGLALREAIEDALGKGSDEPITRGEMESLRRLDVDGVGRLEGIEHAVNLVELDATDGAVSDLAPLAALTSLTTLRLSNNEISDVSALASIESLTRLWLDDNEISDVSALASLESLTRLYLGGNEISDVSALGSLESLRWLELDNNAITDVSALASLQSLTDLGLSDNVISDVSALASLQSLTWLYLGGNAIEDVTALGSLESLTTLVLDNNVITDVSALGSLQSLRWLYLRNNAITGVSALGSLQSLERLDFAGNRIADVAPLVGAGIGVVGLRGNPLSADSIERHVPALRAAGTAVVAGWPVLIFPSAADPSGRQGFVRVVNRSAVGGEVLIDAVDDTGERFGPLRLAIGAGEAAHFNSQDIEVGNAAKGLSGGVGAPTDGVWRLALSSTLDIEVLSYVRTPDGFLTSVHDMLPREGSTLQAAVFNPGSNSAQRSSLRLVNPGAADDSVGVWGWDDRGRLGYAGDLTHAPAGGAATMDAAALEAGGLGDGTGKWRLQVNAQWPAEAASLLTSPGGHLTNLSTAPDAGADGVWRLPLFPAADGASGRQGFVRVINRSWRAGEAQVVAVDDGGARVGPLTLMLQARQTVHFNSDDLQRGNAAKGLPDGAGSPTRGDWRLELTSELDIAVSSYIRTEDGFLTSMHDLVPPGVAAQAARVPIFNPGSNRRQASLLRVVNDGDAAATVRVNGADDAGMPSGEVRLTVPAGETRTLDAADLEAGDAAFEGALGDGVGKWRLEIASDAPVSVMSLLLSPGGYLTNLSTATRP